MSMQEQMDMLIDRLEKVENENKELKIKLESKLTCDFVKSTQKHAIQEFAELLEYKYGHYLCFSFPNIVKSFNKIIEEVLRDGINDGKQI